MNQRLAWIDISRGMSFILVIYAHLRYCNNNLLFWFTPFVLATFFFISGYLYKSSLSFTQVMEQRVRTLLLPFLLFGFSIILLSQFISFGDKIPLSDAILDFLIQIRGRNDELWFVAALFVMNIPFYFLVKYCCDSKTLLIASLLLYLLSTIYIYYLKMPFLPWHVQFFGFGCFYMALGYLYRQYENKLTFLETKSVFLILLICYVAFLYIRKLFTPNYVDFNGSFYIFDSLIIIILGLALCVFLSKRMQNTGLKFPLLSFVGANSLCYFAFHGKACALLQFVVEQLFVRFSIAHTAVIDLFLGIFITLAVTLILIIPCIIINRYFPFVLGKNFKIPLLFR